MLFTWSLYLASGGGDAGEYSKNLSIWVHEFMPVDSNAQMIAATEDPK